MFLAVKGNREIKITEIEVTQLKAQGFEILEIDADGKIRPYGQKPEKVEKPKK